MSGRDTRIAPAADAIMQAVRFAAKSTCAKSRRGAVVYLPVSGNAMFFGGGYNGRPRPFQCTGTDGCRRQCGLLCEHAEARAIRNALTQFGRNVGATGQLELVHVKIDAVGHVVGGKAPCCLQCSRQILDVGWIAGVWLYETPRFHLVSLTRDWSEEEVLALDGPPGTVIDMSGYRLSASTARLFEILQARRWSLVNRDAVIFKAADDPMWHRYTAEAFHRVTMANEGLVMP